MTDPWDGPASVAFMRYINHAPKRAFNHRVGLTSYAESWIERSTDEYQTKQEIEKWRARYIVMSPQYFHLFTLLRHETLRIGDYTEWLALKKRFEEELKVKIEDLMRMMNKSSFDYLMDWPYNIINKFSDGYVPNWKLDIAFHDHWNEDVWRHVAELGNEDIEAIQHYEWKDSSSKRSIDRIKKKFLTQGDTPNAKKKYNYYALLKLKILLCIAI
ncbi:hypothetical protein RFI_19703 [Reticulomyxa filosa]|uniref:Uncharacterized protein n=1 Tax=Reticulomyxa filosa TaxID=46433 RepID=X6MVX8_RETFI|nr:hypothetical protein RFI_19703 [Reticulomyxa filosa]|eukprot:ETO17617.1 hypothetical protein RFI_19703 [Reticulomyxa filosa]